MQNNKQIQIRKEDLNALRFSTPKSLILGNRLLTFSSRKHLRDELVSIQQELPYHQGDTIIYTTQAIVSTPTSGDLQNAKTILEAFVEAVNYLCREDGFLSQGDGLWIMADDAPVMAEDVRNMQDALSYAVEDGAVEDEWFVHLQTAMVDWWVCDFAGEQTAYELLCSFYTTAIAGN